MKLLFNFIVTFLILKAIVCHPFDVNPSENSGNLTYASPMVNAGTLHFPSVNATVATSPSVNAAVLLPTLNATDLLPTVHLNSSYYSDVNETDSFVIVASGGSVMASKTLMKKCSSKFEDTLGNGTIDRVIVHHSAKVTQKVVEFCKVGSIDYTGYDVDELFDFAYDYKISALRTYLLNMGEKENADLLAEDKKRRERLEAGAEEAAKQEGSSSKKNLYITEALLLQILLIFVPRFV